MDHDRMRPPTLLALPTYLAGQLARIGRRVLVESLAAHDLRLPHFAVLTALSDFGPLAQHDLADRLGLNRSHLVGYIDETEHRGLVGRERDPEDRRRQRVTLTGAGDVLIHRLQEIAQGSQEEFLHMLSESERETLITLMRRVVTSDDAAQAHADTGSTQDTSHTSYTGHTS
jgi:DNA-binding MarR family transcriptional regulator